MTKKLHYSAKTVLLSLTFLTLAFFAANTVFAANNLKINTTEAKTKSANTMVIAKGQYMRPGRFNQTSVCA